MNSSIQLIFAADPSSPYLSPHMAELELRPSKRRIPQVIFFFSPLLQIPFVRLFWTNNSSQNRKPHNADGRSTFCRSLMIARKTEINRYAACAFTRVISRWCVRLPKGAALCWRAFLNWVGRWLLVRVVYRHQGLCGLLVVVLPVRCVVCSGS